MHTDFVHVPRYRPAPLGPATFHDAEVLDDEIPPELFDEDEDREDLTAYIHIAELSLQDQ